MQSDAKELGPASPRFRAISAAEFILGAAVVVAANIYKVIPSEVIILAIVAFVSILWRNRSLSAMGFRRPSSWRLILLIALGAAILRIALGFIIEPLVEQIWPAPPPPEEVEKIKGNLPYALLILGFVWVYAAFGEEIAYRGYLLTRGAEALGSSPRAQWFFMILVAVLFGIGHYWNGASGMVSSGVAGLICGAVYLLTGRCLWTCILAHGFIDTIAIALAYFGLND